MNINKIKKMEISKLVYVCAAYDKYHTRDIILQYNWPICHIPKDQMLKGKTSQSMIIQLAHFMLIS